MGTTNTELFESKPIHQAIITLVIPTIISQIITVIYNMADTFFIAQLNEPDQVAAATLIMPPFIMLTAIANLFGIGGASLISRSLGQGDRVKAGRAAALSLWSAGAVALIYGLFIYLFRPVLFPLLGADAATYDYCVSYVFWTIAIGAVPTVISACLAHLVRAEGYARQASLGVALGGILNIVLDPIFIFSLGLGITGAAIATMLSNVAATGYFLRLLHRNRHQTVIKLSRRYLALGQGLLKEILLVGFPSFLMMLMSIFSNTILNRLVVSYSNQAIAGMGIAKKIDMLAFAMAGGFTQGVMPLIGYNYAAKNFKRMRDAIKTAFIFSLTAAAIITLGLYFGAVSLIRFFIRDGLTISFGQHFLRIICLTSIPIAVTLMIISIFQATGQKLKPMVLSLLRKGGLDVPLMFLMNSVAGVQGIPWATPMADGLAMSTAVALFIPYWRSLKDQVTKSEQNMTKVIR